MIDSVHDEKNSFKQQEIILFQENEKRKVIDLLNKLISNHLEICGEFTFDVDQNVFQDYLDYVPFEMNIEKIKQRLEDNYYRSSAQITLEIDLVMQNCRIYNENNPILMEQAQKVCEFLNLIVNKFNDQTTFNQIEGVQQITRRSQRPPRQAVATYPTQQDRQIINYNEQKYENLQKQKIQEQKSLIENYQNQRLTRGMRTNIKEDEDEIQNIQENQRVTRRNPIGMEIQEDNQFKRNIMNESQNENDQKYQQNGTRLTRKNKILFQEQHKQPQENNFQFQQQKQRITRRSLKETLQNKYDQYDQDNDKFAESSQDSSEEEQLYNDFKIMEKQQENKIRITRNNKNQTYESNKMTLKQILNQKADLKINNDKQIIDDFSQVDNFIQKRMTRRNRI